MTIGGLAKKADLSRFIPKAQGTGGGDLQIQPDARMSCNIPQSL
jgi:hypothetical protein